MKMKRFFGFVGFVVALSLIHTACAPEDVLPEDPSEMDSIWTEPRDTTDMDDDFPGDTTIIDIGGDDDEPTDSTDWDDDFPDDSTGTDPGDTLVFGG